ncbi:hypothetical protein [Nocardia brasiliensis]|uniref:hypothetical protein n=1 Tax=Nocardia brasiliensis TaxID=37326 RepID=UPI00245683BF|nr:hypothetical protein [Nocardia brasiliensis]
MFDSPHSVSPAQVVVALPGSGSDADFARRAFEPAGRARRLDVVAVQPDPAAVVASYRAALAGAAAAGAGVFGGL